MRFPPLIFSIIAFANANNCSFSSFYIAQNEISHGSILDTVRVDGLHQCSSLCLENQICSGYNYLIDGLGEAHCMLINSEGEAKETKNLIPQSVLYGSKRICLLDSCEAKSFAFEKYPERTIRDEKNIMETHENVTLEECLRKCQITANCRSSVFDRVNSLCGLATISQNTVYNTRTAFSFDENSDVWENNCMKTPISPSSCTWMRLSSAGLPDLFDSKEMAESADHCQTICAHRMLSQDICRSFTFDSSAFTCLLSTSGARSSGRSPLGTGRPNSLSHGDIDDCADLSLKCHPNGLEVRGHTMRQFRGFFRIKRGKEIVCERNLSSVFDISVHFPFEGCGLTKTANGYTGVIHVKEGSTSLVTIRDKVLQVECRMHQQMESTHDQMLSVTMNVSETNRTNMMMSDRVIIVPSRAPPVPRFSLSVLSIDGSPADTVKLGESGWVAVVMNMKDTANGFSVSSLIARDTNGTSNITLIDSSGCVVNSTVIDRIWRLSDKEIRFRVNFGSFGKEMEIVYHAFVETCSTDCIPKCNEELVWKDEAKIDSSTTVNRHRRSISARQIELSQDIYRVHGSRIAVTSAHPSISQSSSKMTHDFAHLKSMKELDHDKDASSTVHVEKPSSFHSSLTHCVFDDSSCLYTIILTAIQTILLLAIICIMLCYFMQYREYQAEGASLRSLSRGIQHVRIKNDRDDQSNQNN